MLNVTALATKMDMDERGIKMLCRHHKVIVNKGPGFYLIDEDDFDAKIKKDAKPAKKRGITVGHQKKMAQGKIDKALAKASKKKV